MNDWFLDFGFRLCCDNAIAVVGVLAAGATDAGAGACTTDTGAGSQGMWLRLILFLHYPIAMSEFTK